MKYIETEKSGTILNKYDTASPPAKGFLALQLPLGITSLWYSLKIGEQFLTIAGTYIKRIED